MRTATPLLAILLTASVASAQSLEMRIPGADPKQPHPVSLAKADVSAVIAGGLARTSMTMTFENAADRVLEGELVFPLPEGATVCAYALDVGGQLVDAVTIEKDKARITFETEVRKGIDPGIVEKVQGNNFRTRVYPIPAKGSRTIRVEYVSELIGGQNGSLAYQLPLKWSTPVKEAKLRVEVVKASAAPTAEAQGLADFTFAKWEDRFVAEQKLQNAKLDAGVTVALPPIPAGQAIVERRVTSQSLENLADARMAEQSSRVEHYFVLNDTPSRNTGALQHRPRQRVCVVWDASLSRADVDRGRELALLEKHLKAANVPADLIVLRNVAERPLTFESHDKLIEHLKTIAYDGGTSMSSLKLLANYASYFPEARLNTPPNYDYFLLFSDGLSNLGADAPTAAEAPVYAISNDPRSNHAALSQIARSSGGMYVNLERMTDEQATEGLGAMPFSLISVEHAEGEVAEVYPRTPLPVTPGARVAITGKLLANQAKLTLNYGRDGRVTHRVPITISREGAAEGLGIVGRFWAQAKAAELSTAADRYESEITQLGKDFGLVTPFTSMIVLETVEQYLQHKIVPPRSRPEIYAQFMQRIEQQKVAAATEEKAKIDRVVQMWNARVDWWQKEYTYPKGFKYVAKDAKDGEVADPSPIAANRVPARVVNPEAAPRPAPATGAPAPAVPPTTGRPTETAAGQDARGYAERRQRTADPASRSDAQAVLREALADAPDAGSGARGEGRGRGGAGGVAGGEALRQRAFYRNGQAPADGATPATPEFAGNFDVAGTAIRLKEWAPEAPYLKALVAAGDQLYATYLKERATHKSSPAFYLDCADFFAKAKQPELALRILTNIPELALDDGRLIRIAAHRLQQLGHLDLAIDLFEKVSKLRPEEPQSFRDLALALSQRAEQRLAASDSAVNWSPVVEDWNRALGLLHKVVMNPWQRFEEIEVIALMEANRIIAKYQSAPSDRRPQLVNPFDPRLIKLLDLDVRVIMTWDTDNTDIDLHVVEPSGETAFYSHNRTTIGGLVSRDFTQGYGPEEYCLRKLMPGQYQIKAHFYGNRDQKLVGPTTLQATIVTNFGRPDEKRQAITLRLTDAKDWVDIGTVTLGEAK